MSTIEAFPLFGFDLDDYDSLFSDKLELLLRIRENTHVNWTGRHRAPLTGQADAADVFDPDGYSFEVVHKS